MQSVAAGTIYIALFMTISKILGLFRNILTAALFGTSWRLDAIFIALKPASVAVSLFAGATATALVPVYVDLRLKDEEKAKEYAWNVLFWIAVVYLLVSSLFFLFPGWIVRVFAPGFKEEILEYAARKMKYVAVFMVIMALQTVLSSLMRSSRKFFQYGLSMVFYNVFAIPVLWLTADDFGEAAYILSTIVGQFSVLFAMTVLFWRHLRISPPSFSLVKGTLKSSSVLTTSNAISAINPVVDNAFASLLPSGSISSLNYSLIILNQFQAFVGIFVQTSYTELAEGVSRGDEVLTIGRMRKTVESSTRVILPLVLWLVAMPDFFISILLERGAFTSRSTALVSAAIAGYALVAVVAPISGMINQYLVSIGRLRVIFLMSLSSIFLNAFFDWVFMKPLKHAGIALSTSMVALFSTIVRYVYSRKFLEDYIPWKGIAVRLLLGIPLVLAVWKMEGFGKIVLGNAMFGSFFLWSARDEISTIYKKIVGKIRRG